MVNIPNLEIPSFNDDSSGSCVPSPRNIRKSAFTGAKRVMLEPTMKGAGNDYSTAIASASSSMVSKCVDKFCIMEYAEMKDMIKQTVGQMIQTPSDAKRFVGRLVCHITDLCSFFTTNANFPIVEKEKIICLSTAFQHKGHQAAEPDVDRLVILQALFNDTFDHPLTSLFGQTIYNKALFAISSFFSFAHDVVVAVVGHEDDLAKVLKEVCIRYEWANGFPSPPYLSFQPIVRRHGKRRLPPPPSPPRLSLHVDDNDRDQLDDIFALEL